MNVIRVFAAKTEEENPPINDRVRKYSRLLKIHRVLAWYRKFTTNARAKMKVYKPTVGELTTEEMLTALTLCIKRAQKLTFAEEIYALKMNLELPFKSNLRPFRPFLKKVDSFFVGGRILHAAVDYSTTHDYSHPTSSRSTRDVAYCMGAPHEISLN